MEIRERVRTIGLLSHSLKNAKTELRAVQPRDGLFEASQFLVSKRHPSVSDANPYPHQILMRTQSNIDGVRTDSGGPPRGVVNPSGLAQHSPQTSDLSVSVHPIGGITGLETR